MVASPPVRAANRAKAVGLVDKLTEQHERVSERSVKLSLPGRAELLMTLQTATVLKSAEKTAVMDLFESNMKPMYEASNDGYDADEKRNELFDPSMRYCLVTDPSNKPQDKRAPAALAAFAAFRFLDESTLEEVAAVPVVYW